MSESCIRLSNDSSFLNSSSILKGSNTYSNIYSPRKNIWEQKVHNIGLSIEPVVMFFYNSRNGLLFMNREVIESVKRLENIGKLDYDWNGYGAKSFSSTLIDKCEKIVMDLSHQPKIYPTGRQSIQFQYELKDRSYLEFEIFDDRTMCLMVPKRVYAEAKEMRITDAEEKHIKEIVDNFYERNSTGK